MTFDDMFLRFYHTFCNKNTIVRGEHIEMINYVRKRTEAYYTQMRNLFPPCLEGFDFIDARNIEVDLALPVYLAANHTRNSELQALVKQSVEDSVNLHIASRINCTNSVSVKGGSGFRMIANVTLTLARNAKLSDFIDIAHRFDHVKAVAKKKIKKWEHDKVWGY